MLSKGMKSYLLVTSAITFVFLTGSFLLVQNQIMNLPAWMYLSAIAIFVVAGTFSHYILLKSATQRVQHFVNLFMGAQSLKILLHLSVMFLVAFTNRAFAVHFIMLYMVLYLFFTTSETILLLRYFKKKDQKPN